MMTASSSVVSRSTLWLRSGRCACQQSSLVGGVVLLVALLWSTTHAQTMVNPELEAIAGRPIPENKYGCFLDNKTNTNAVFAGRVGHILFRFEQLLGSSSVVLQNNTDPYLNHTFLAKDNNSFVICTASGGDTNANVAHYHVTVLTPLTFNEEAYYISLSPRAYDTVPCPYSGSGLTCTWMIDKTTQFSCNFTADNPCFGCSKQSQCYSPPRVERCTKATDKTCFQKIDRAGHQIMILPDCYGCLRVTATSTIFGVTKTETRLYMLLDRPPLVQPCDQPLATGPDLIIYSKTKSPTTYTLPIANVTLFFAYRSQDFQTVTLFHETPSGTQQILNDENYKFVNSPISRADCTNNVSLTILNPGESQNGTYAFRIKAKHENISWVNITVGFYGRPCGDDVNLDCKHGGSCVLNSFNVPQCLCPSRQFGRFCQLECPPFQIVNDTITFLEACTFVTVLLQCPHHPGTVTSNQTIWYHDGLRIGHGTPTAIYLQKNGVKREDGGNYSCYDELSGQYIGSVMVYVAAAPVFMSSSSLTAPGNYTLVVDKEETYAADLVTYAWYRPPTNENVVCGGSADICILNQSSATLQVHNVPGCQGIYAGCISNPFSTVCHMFNETFNEIVCPADPIITKVDHDPRQVRRYESGEPYADVMAPEDVGCKRLLWYFFGDGYSHEGYTSVVTMNTHLACCWRCTPYEKLPDGNVTACIAPPANTSLSSGFSNVCSPHPLSVKTFSVSSSKFGIPLIAGLAGGGAVLLVAVAACVVVIRRGRTKFPEGESGTNTGHSRLVPRGEGADVTEPLICQEG